MTRVFISWSGALSRKLGESLRNWLPATLQNVQPYFSPDDIEKGTKWNSEIAIELQEADIGIICLTQDNTDKPWILFEAGALSKSMETSRVCTLLFNLEPAEVKGPLTSFQATRFSGDDFKRLVSTINKAAGDAQLDAAVLEEVFDMWWPKLEREVTGILQSHTEVRSSERRSDRDILEEVLELARMNASRSAKSPRLNQRAIDELIDCLNESLFALRGCASSDVVRDLIKRLDPPITYLCNEAGAMDAYDRFRTQLAAPGMRPGGSLLPPDDPMRTRGVGGDALD